MEFKEKDIEKLSFDQLEEESSKVIERLSDDTLGLDEATNLYAYGKKIAERMETLLGEIEKQIQDTIQE